MLFQRRLLIQVNSCNADTPDIMHPLTPKEETNIGAWYDFIVNLT